MLEITLIAQQDNGRPFGALQHGDGLEEISRVGKALHFANGIDNYECIGPRNLVVEMLAALSAEVKTKGRQMINRADEMRTRKKTRSSQTSSQSQASIKTGFPFAFVRCATRRDALMKNDLLLCASLTLHPDVSIISISVFVSSKLRECRYKKSK